MYFSRKKPAEDYPTELTAIWSCSKEDCNGWMRKNYSFEDVPTCMQCKSPMIPATKQLPVLLDSKYELKAAMKNMKTEG